MARTQWYPARALWATRLTLQGQRLARRALPYVLMAPALGLLAVVLVYPLLYSFRLSFTDWTLLNFRTGAKFIGLANYQKVLLDGDFWNALGVTLVFMVSSTAIEFALGLGIAHLMARDYRGKGWLNPLILLPFMCTNVVVGLVFRIMMNYDLGVINYLLDLVHLPPVNWLGDVATAMPAVVLMDVWNMTSFMALLLLAGLQALPEEPFESAIIDGASRAQILWHITLPMLRPVILVAVLWRLIDTFKVFDVIYILTGGGPAKATDTMSIFAFRTGFQFFKLGYASAIAYIMVLIMLVLAIVAVRLTMQSAKGLRKVNRV
ncbi:MAG: sugar ABC transporter permease [Deinococcus sp.]|nr:sugar ABC transporter permease [Deinococcus sp.]